MKDKGWKYFAGEMGETEAAMLLSDKGKGAFLVRSNPGGGGGFVISFVNPTEPTIKMDGIWHEDTESKEKKRSMIKWGGGGGNNDYKGGKEEEGERTRWEDIRGNAVMRCQHRKIGVEEGMFRYSERDGYYFEVRRIF